MTSITSIIFIAKEKLEFSTNISKIIINKTSVSVVLAKDMNIIFDKNNYKKCLRCLGMLHNKTIFWI